MLDDHIVDHHAQGNIHRERNPQSHRYVEARVSFWCCQTHGCRHSDIGGTGGQDGKDESIADIMDEQASDCRHDATIEKGKEYSH